MAKNMDIINTEFSEIEKKKETLEQYRSMLEELKIDSFSKKIVEKMYGKK